MTKPSSAEFSEKFSKKGGRGRPRDRQLDAWEYLGFAKQTTRRGRANYVFMNLACVALKFDKRPPDQLSWLRDPKSPGNPATKRHTILASLGRIPDKKLMTKFAERLCEAQPRVSDAIPMIRRMQYDHMMEEIKEEIRREEAEAEARAVEETSSKKLN